MVAPKREKMACQRSMAQKKREKGVTMSQKKETWMIQERKAIISRSKPYPSIHSYTCTFWSRLHDLFLHGSSLWLYNIQNTSVPCLILPWAPQRLVVVGRIKGRHCPGKKIQDECLKRVILGALPCFQNSFNKVSPDGLQIYEQVSITLCTILTLNSPRQGDS